MTKFQAWIIRRWASLRGRSTFRFRGLNVQVPPGVLNPTMMRSSLFFAEACADSVVSFGAESSPPRVLELGCGAGLASLFAANAGARVTALDCEVAAVAATQHNARRNDLELRTLVSSWDEALAAESLFDIVLLNPPFLQQGLRNQADQWLERALVSGPGHEHLQASLAAAARRLSAEGQAVLLTSERSGIDLVQRLVTGAGLAVRDGQTRKIQGERFVLSHLALKR